MIKKYSVLAATLVVASSGSSFASSQKNPHQGVSIGLQGGYDVFKHEHKDRNGDKQRTQKVVFSVDSWVTA
jgi:hypothetical protein